jgi:hypothetical protein
MLIYYNEGKFISLIAVGVLKFLMNVHIFLSTLHTFLCII